MPSRRLMQTGRPHTQPEPRLADRGPHGAAAPAQALHEIFEAQADARPDAVALVVGGAQTTYGALESRANRLARQLRARGVRRGSLVAMLLPRTADAYATLLGILKAGAAYVPLDLEYPADRVAFILADSRADALVTTASLAACHGAFGGPVIRVDADHESGEVTLRQGRGRPQEALK